MVVVTTVYRRTFPILHRIELDLSCYGKPNNSDNSENNARIQPSRAQLLHFVRHCTQALGFTNSHHTNWDVLSDDELLFLVSHLQSRRAPALSADVLRAVASTNPIRLFRPYDLTLTTKLRDPYVPAYVLIAPSSIRGAKLGVFAAVDIPKEFLLGEYDGQDVKTEQEAKFLTNVENNAYIFSIYNINSTKHEFLVAKDGSRLYPEFTDDNTGRIKARQGSWPRFINECSHTRCNIYYSVVLPSKGTKSKILVTSSRTIRRGEELFSRYVVTEADLAQTSGK